MAFAAVGTRIQINTSTIAELTEINGVSLSSDTLDVTNLSSPSGFREFITGLKDGGEVSISGYFSPGDANGQIAVYNSYLSGAQASYNILFPTNIASWAFNGVVSNYETSVTLEDLVTFSATIKITGVPTLGTTAGAGLTALSLAGTGGTLSPAFNTANRVYSFGGVTATSFTLTATGAGTLQLFVDGVLLQTLTSGSASSSVSLPSVGGKSVVVLQTESGKVPVAYDINVIKTS